MTNFNCIIFKCRKCESIYKIVVPDNSTVDRVLDAISDLSESDCFMCGEEPYDNWYLVDVEQSKEKK